MSIFHVWILKIKHCFSRSSILFYFWPSYLLMTRGSNRGWFKMLRPKTQMGSLKEVLALRIRSAQLWTLWSFGESGREWKIVFPPVLSLCTIFLLNKNESLTKRCKYFNELVFCLTMANGNNWLLLKKTITMAKTISQELYLGLKKLKYSNKANLSWYLFIQTPHNALFKPNLSF